jgi:hypothetical protein
MHTLKRERECKKSGNKKVRIHKRMTKKTSGLYRKSTKYKGFDEEKALE